MRVRVLKAMHPVGHCRIGQIIPEMPEGVAATLIKRGIVEDAAAAPAPKKRGGMRAGADYITRNFV